MTLSNIELYKCIPFKIKRIHFTKDGLFGHNGIVNNVFKRQVRTLLYEQNPGIKISVYLDFNKGANPNSIDLNKQSVNPFIRLSKLLLWPSNVEHLSLNVTSKKLDHVERNVLKEYLSPMKNLKTFLIKQGNY